MKKTNEAKNELMNKIFDYFGIFIVASIIGWIYEVIFYAITEGRIENSGFFYGPYVPVYGFGAILIVLILKRFKKNPFIVFTLSILITGLLEYITGTLMMAIWNRRWWDYTGLLLNIKGYVCLRSVISFAIGSIPLIYFIEPKILQINNKMNKKTKKIIYGIAFITFITDLVLCLALRNPI